MIYLILGAVMIVLLVLAAPISLGYDTGEEWLRIKWLGLSLKKRLGAERPKKPKKTVARKDRRSGWAVLAQLWEKRQLCLELIHRAWGCFLEVFRTLSFRDSQATMSLPDPMLNGLLYGVVSNINLKNMDLSVNFENRNYAKIRVTVYPYRVAARLTAFLLHLPYIRIIRFARDLKKTGKTRKMKVNREE
jgi:hypothetical protein